MSHADLDTIILGQGLAGSLLAWNLIQRGQRVLVIDQAHPVTASRIAAGLVNPVTGKRLVKQHNTDAFLTAALSQYTQLKNQFDTVFFHPKPMIRLFKSETDRAVYAKRNTDPAYQAYLGQEFNADTNPLIHSPDGGFEQQQTGYLDTTALLDHLKNYFISLDCYQKLDLDYTQIDLSNNIVTIDKQRADRLVFCEGYQATLNPWFNWLPFKLAKGEILTLHSTSSLPDTIINSGKWLLPINKYTCKFGATYQWHELDEHSTTDAKTELLTSLKQLFITDMGFNLIQQQAGIRPCTQDTAAYIGLHPRYPQLGFFNGFGSRGSMLIPWHARHFCEHLLQHKPLDKKINIKRYWKTDA